ncbi:MAG: DUF1553 domain-containing protein [Fuerstiella sp.]
MIPVRFITCALTVIALLMSAQPAGVADDAAVQYNRDVRPILADRCLQCHGPDAAARQADLRLDQRNDVVAPREEYRVIDPGHPERSELLRRILSTDPAERMPPPESGPALKDREIRILQQWIQAGAVFQQHWSFIPASRPTPPLPQDSRPAVSDIDRFILARLQHEGLSLSSEAAPTTLIRRVTLDLTGLPPTLNEIDAFMEDRATDPERAYERLVDRLLASERYGERMAGIWLDAARYADTNGYFTDEERTMWPWRDWVIKAFNDNMPFDQFTIEQLAGDLLPDATIDQQIATGFNRNHMVNNETGIIEEEFRVEYVADRVDTTATVWLGLTVGCARCHDHKYDPVSQQDFYRFFAIFNNVPERGLSGSSGNSAPYLKVLSSAQQAQLDSIRTEVVAAEATLASYNDQLYAAQTQWETNALQTLPRAPIDGLVTHLTFEKNDGATTGVGAVETSEGMFGNAIRLNGESYVTVSDIPDFDGSDAFSFGVWVRPSGAGCVLSKMDDSDGMRGYDLTLRKGKAVVNLVHRWNQDAIRLSTIESIPSGQWQHLFVTCDGSMAASGVRIYRNGQPLQVDVEEDSLSGSLTNREPLRLGRRKSSASYSGQIDNVRFYDRELIPPEVQNLFTDEQIRTIVTCLPERRSDEQKKLLTDWFVQNLAERQIAEAAVTLKQLKSRERQMLKAVPTTMVMQESDQPRPAFLLVRGEYDQQGQEVRPGIPAFLQPKTSSDAANQESPARTVRNRLELAEWLVDSSNPLTARVTVNRLWLQFFGTGLVSTIDDFGLQGEWPSHPELLDWLAVELVESGWNIKHMLRTIVMSRTYRQSADCSSALLQADPENRLLARGPRFRLSAEAIRDNALAISGLLQDHIGGPPVRPYQPAGLWEEVTYDGGAVYQQGTGRSLYRRSLYTFWKRQVPPPNMAAFDAPTRETCVVQRSRTNTPLQALVLMNDPTFVEAARKLAERVMKPSGVTVSDRAATAFRTATARPPTAQELEILVLTFQQQQTAFARRPEAAQDLLNVGESPRDRTLNVVDLAAWTTVCNMILCLDETITKP